MIKFEDGRFYIGSRQSKIPANEDVKYWGSPVTYKHLWEDASLSKTKHILKVCDSFEEMYKLEPKLIKEAWKKYPDLCLNKNAAGSIHPDIIHRQLTEKEIKERSIIGKKCAELGLGVHSKSFKNSPETKERHKKAGLKLKREKKGIFRSKEERREWCIKGAKKLGDLNVELGRGIHRPDLQHKRKEWAGIGGRISHKKFKFISPEGKIYEGTNYTQWCRDMGFKPHRFTQLTTGRQETANGGWRLG
tara:strand:+ start:65 stop:805 length:741 start_codon:yes stop_codon:yes gene_type:complete